MIRVLILDDNIIKFVSYLPAFHYENISIQIYWKFYHQKMKIFR